MKKLFILLLSLLSLSAYSQKLQDFPTYVPSNLTGIYTIGFFETSPGSGTWLPARKILYTDILSPYVKISDSTKYKSYWSFVKYQDSIAQVIASLSGSLNNYVLKSKHTTDSAAQKALIDANILAIATVTGWGNHAGLYPLLSGSYSNPSWITGLAWSKVTGAPSFLTNITGLVTAGTNMTRTGSGTIADPYVFNSTASGGTSTPLYSTTGANTDGAMTQAASTNAFEAKNSNIQTHIARTDNPHNVTASQVGLDTVKANLRGEIAAVSSGSSSSGGSNLGWFVVDAATYGDNDSTGVTQQLQSLIDSAHAKGGGTVYFPNGIYRHRGLTFYPDVRLIGESRWSAALKAAPGFTGTMITMVDNASGVLLSTNKSENIEGLQIDGNNTAAIGLDLNNFPLFYMQDMYFRNFTSKGLNSAGLLMGEFNSCIFISCTTGASLDRSTPMLANMIKFSNCWFQYNTTWGLTYDDGAQLILDHVDFENNGTSGNASTGSLKATNLSGLGEGVGVVITNCWFEQNYGTQIYLRGAGRSSISNTVMNFNHSGSVGLDVGSGVKALIQSSKIDGHTTDINLVGDVVYQNSDIGPSITAAGGTLKTPTLTDVTPTATNNLLSYTEELDNAVWTKKEDYNGATTVVAVTANATTAPDGTSTADKLTETATNTVHALYQRPSVTPVVDRYTFSIYVKAAERGRVAIAISDFAADDFRLFINTDGTNASVASYAGSRFSNLTYGSSDAGSGWRRIWVSADNNSTSGNLTAMVQTIQTNSGSDVTLSYNGTAGSGLYVWGAQLEIGSITTYQKKP